MKIHEYQGKAILKQYGVPVPRGIVARTPEEAEAAARELGTDVVVVKAQIHAGGRGKGGGVKLAKSPAEAKEIASQMLGMHLVTHQTGPEGREVKTLLIEEGLPIPPGRGPRCALSGFAEREGRADRSRGPSGPPAATRAPTGLRRRPERRP